jgi:glycosyltransferase involved in cell wall biosynthesis
LKQKNLNSVSKDLCISTLDLQFFRHGGVVTKAMILADVAKENGFSPFFITPSVDLHKTLKRTASSHSLEIIRKTEFRSYPCFQFGARYPEFEQNSHRFKDSELRKILTPNIPCFAVSGNNHAARPFLDSNLPFSIWIGTTYWEDCRDRIQKAPWSIRKSLDLLTKSPCEELERQIFREANQICCVTSYTEKCVIQQEPTARQKTIITPIPIDCQIFTPSTNPDKKGIVLIGRLDDPRKNIDLLLKAFTEFAKKNTEHDLILIGSGNEKTEKELASHPFANRIHWKRQISEEEKIKHLQNALVLVVSSFQEGFGIVGSEALACGIPVITTPCGGTASYILHEETGLKLNTFSPTELFEALLRLASEKTFRDNLSRNARHYSLEKLDITALRPMLLKIIYNQVKQSTA